MNTEEQARELMAQQRQQTEHQQDSMLRRAEDELANPEDTPLLEEKARELMAQQRQQLERLQDAMLERAEENLASPNDQKS